jgi:hypothetical protein
MCQFVAEMLRIFCRNVANHLIERLPHIFKKFSLQ